MQLSSKLDIKAYFCQCRGREDDKVGHGDFKFGVFQYNSMMIGLSSICQNS